MDLRSVRNNNRFQFSVGKTSCCDRADQISSFSVCNWNMSFFSSSPFFAAAAGLKTVSGLYGETLVIPCNNGAIKAEDVFITKWKYVSHSRGQWLLNGEVCHTHTYVVWATPSLSTCASDRASVSGCFYLNWKPHVTDMYLGVHIDWSTNTDAKYTKE